MVRLLLYELISVPDPFLSVLSCTLFTFSLFNALNFSVHFSLSPSLTISFSLPPSLPHFFLCLTHSLSLCVGYSLGGDAYWATGLHVFAPLPFTSGEFFGKIRMHAFTTAGNLIPLSELVLLREQLIIIGHRKCDVHQHKPCYLPPA